MICKERKRRKIPEINTLPSQINSINKSLISSKLPEEWENKLNLRYSTFYLIEKLFFQNTSHQLKSPLMSIQGYAEAIKDGIIKKDEIPESMDIIIKNSLDLEKIL